MNHRNKMAELYSSGEKSESARKYDADFPIFRQLGRTGPTRYTPSVRGDSNGRVYIYSHDQISLHEYDEMRMDGQIKAGLMLVKLPIMQANWSISCDDQDIAAFCTQVMKSIWPQYIQNVLLSLDFGYSVFEKIWSLDYAYKVTQSQGQGAGSKERVYPTAVTLNRLLHLDPATLYLLAYRWSGDFAGVKQYVSSSATIPSNKCLLFSNDCEFQEWYGVPRVKPCYPYWTFKKLMYEWTNVFYETYSLPTKVIRYPAGSREVGRDSNNQPIIRYNEDDAIELGEELRNNHTIAVPSNRYSETDVPQWDITAFETGRTGGDQLAYISHLDLMILKSLLVPQLALEVGSSGSWALAQTQVDFFFLGEQALMKQIERPTNDMILKQLTRYNFGPHAPLPRLNFQPISSEMKSQLTNVLMETLGSGRPFKTKDERGLVLDMQWVADSLGVPLQSLDESEMGQYQQREAATSQQFAGQQPGDPNDPQQPGDPNDQSTQRPDGGNYGGDKWQYGDPKGGADPTAKNDQGGELAETWVNGEDGLVCLFEDVP